MFRKKINAGYKKDVFYPKLQVAVMMYGTVVRIGCL